MQADRVTVVIEKEGDVYSAVCLALGVASQGATLDEAKQNILEAIDLYLEACQEQGMSLEQCWHPVPETLRAGHSLLPPVPVDRDKGEERWTGELTLPGDRQEAAASAYA